MNDETHDEVSDSFKEPGEERNRKGAIGILFLAAALGVGALSYYLTTTPGPNTGAPSAAEASKAAEQTAAKPAVQAPAAAAPEPAVSQSTAPPEAAAVTTSKQTTVTDTASSSIEVAKPDQTQAASSSQQTTQAVENTSADPAPIAAAKEAPVTQAPVEPEIKSAEETQVASAVTPPPVAATKLVPPTFDTVRVEATGDALIAGRAAPGTEVTVKLNGQVLGKTTANQDGAFVFVPDKPLPAGAGTLSLETEAGGTLVASENSVAVAVKEQAKGEALVAVVKPDAPVTVVQAPTSGEAAKSNKVVLDAVEYDDAGAIVFSGRSNPGSAIRIYVDNALTGEVNADAGGKWSFNGKSAVAPGKHTLRADEVDKSGKVLSRVELPFLREETAKVAATETPSAEPTAIGIVADKGNAAVPQRIVIQPGNNLWRLSRMVYGKGTRYTVIYEANKDQIRNPDLIYPGQIFAMPVTP